MKISILTLFPEMFSGPIDHSILKRAQEKKLIEIEYINIRDFGSGPHKMVDDTSYGGGIGMVMKVDVLHKAIESAKSINPRQSRNLRSGGAYRISYRSNERNSGQARTPVQKVVLLSASGKTFNQQKAKDFSQLDHLILLCGHYEGVDERIKEYIDEEISIGDFVLTGGEIPAMLITDAVTRLISGVITKGATDEESFTTTDNGNLLEYPHYTKPQIYENHSVPQILLSGDHKKIKEWRIKKSYEKTKKLRPDLLKSEKNK